jgi:two-component system, OmpR family, KDP operon response regulator KdpE
MTRSRIIIAGTPHTVFSQLGPFLKLAGHRVAEVGSAAQAIRETAAGLHDVLIVAPNLTGMCTYDFCRTIRPKSNLGIILLIQNDDRQTKIDALEAGADDYMLAPFQPEELLARVRALLRRVAHAGSLKPKLILSGRTVDLHTHEVTGPEHYAAHLTPKEFDVLQYLLDHANKSVSNQELARAVWQRESGGDFEYLRIVIGQLRRKLEPNPENPQHIITHRARGYLLRTHPAGNYSEADLIPASLRHLPPAAQNDTPAMVQ